MITIGIVHMTSIVLGSAITLSFMMATVNEIDLSANALQIIMLVELDELSCYFPAIYLKVWHHEKTKDDYLEIPISIQHSKLSFIY